MSDKYNYDELVDVVTDTISDWFNNLEEVIPNLAHEDEKANRGVLGIMVMCEAIRNLTETGYCQHDISNMVSRAKANSIHMREVMAKEEGRKPFLIECGHDDRTSFLEVMEPVSKRIN